jgi:hypothetical protein
MSKAVALKEDKALALADFADEILQDSGKGVSHSQDDNIIPLVYVLQALSPAVNKRNPNYVDGAEAGDLLKRNSIHKPLIKGNEGFIFQPCFFDKVWVEWRPNRGGFAGTHKDRPADAREEETIVEGKPRKQWVRPNGNVLVETRQHVGYADGEPYVIPFSSSGHTVSRTWMQMMNQQFIPGTNKIAPSFAKKYRLTTTERTKDSNSWFVIKVEDLGDAGWVGSKDEYLKGKMLYDAFASGEKKAADVEEQGGDNSVPF